MIRSRQPLSRDILLFLALFIVVRLIAGGYLAWWQGVTIDEPDFLFGGLFAWTERGYWIDVDNPPLLKMIVTLPALFAGLVMPAPENFAGEFARADHYALGKALLFQLNPRGQTEFLLYSARGLTLAIFAALALAWAREMIRRQRSPGMARAALIAFALLLLDPAFLSLSSLAVLDTAAALLSAMALLATLRWAAAIERRSVLPVALLWAAAVTIKFTSLILLVVTAALLFLRLAGAIVRDRIDWPRAPYFTRLFTRRILLGTFLFLGTVWIIYGFEFGRMIDRLEPYYVRRGESIHQKIDSMPPVARQALLPLKVPIPMPSFFTGAVRIFRAGSIEKKSWLLGEIHESGSRLYYPIVFALKTPLVVLLLAFTGAAALMIRWGRVRRRRRVAFGPPTERFLPLAVTIVFVIFVFPRTNNMGYRYLLPLLPFVYMLAAEGIAWIASWRKPVRMAAMLPIVLLILMDAWCLKSAWPNPLAFANAAGGGPRRAWHIATDSNVDWGQEIRRLDFVYNNVQWVEFKKYGGVTKPYEMIYTPDALEFYGFEMNPLDEAAWKKIEPYLRGEDSSTSLPVSLIWSATKATGFSPAPPEAQAYLLKAMQSTEPEPFPANVVPFYDQEPMKVYQYGQSYFVMTLK